MPDDDFTVYHVECRECEYKVTVTAEDAELWGAETIFDAAVTYCRQHYRETDGHSVGVFWT